MEKNKLDEILLRHKQWIENEGGGRRADLQDADLQDADLQDADLRGADLRRADLQGADLRGADLQGADLDFSCLPLWCGGSRFKCSQALVRQIFAHVCSLEVVGADEEMTAAINSIRKEAAKSHRASVLDIFPDE